MLNEYVWKLYLKSGGEDIVEFFRKNLHEEMTEEYPEFIRKLVDKYCADKDTSDNVYKWMQDLYNEIKELINNVPDDISESDSSENDIRNDVDISVLFEEYLDYIDPNNELHNADGTLDYKLVFSEIIAAAIEYDSTWLSIEYPGIFYPYYFADNYNVLTSISDIFGIKLPPLPQKADYKGRIMFYPELCRAFRDFCEGNNLKYYEFYAFLYDFAPSYVGGAESYIVKNFPEPKRAFFIGAGGEGVDMSGEDDPNCIARWQVKPEVRVGDMIVMYHRTPVSAITSVWRSVSVGFIDPFFYYYYCSYIGNPVKIKAITIKELKEDPILREMPIVKKNLQGINGVEMRPLEYNHIIDYSNAKCPLLENAMESGSQTYINESDVEEKLIKPLLEKLSYSDREYTTQLRIKVGNHNHMLIPDFVLRPSGNEEHRYGFSVIEAKRSITNNKQLDETKTQVRSYARQLNAKYAAIASQEGIWVMSEKDDYTEIFLHYSFLELEDVDSFHELEKILGNR